MSHKKNHTLSLHEAFSLLLIVSTQNIHKKANSESAITLRKSNKASLEEFFVIIFLNFHDISLKDIF